MKPLDRQDARVNDYDAAGTDDEYVCGVCGESFPSETALEQHIREVGLVD